MKLKQFNDHVAKFQNEETPKSYYEVGQNVSILDGPFMGLQGAIGHVDPRSPKIKSAGEYIWTRYSC